jgi:predicted transcriptional regulator
LRFEEIIIIPRPVGVHVEMLSQSTLHRQTGTLPAVRGWPRTRGSDRTVKANSMRAAQQHSSPRFPLGTTTCRDFLDHKRRLNHSHAVHYYSCSPGDAVDAVLGSVKIKRQSGLPVIDPQERLVGIVTKHDLATKEGMLVEDVMSAPPVSIFDNARLGSALDLMSKYKVSRLPVVDEEDGKCVGIITADDILVQREADRPVRPKTDVHVLEKLESGSIDM